MTQSEEQKIQVGSVNSKPVMVSKTMIAAAVTAIAPYIPQVGKVIESNPETSMTVAGIIFAVLRLVTTKGVEWKWRF